MKKTIGGFLRANFPGTAKFCGDFFKAMSNEPGGHSLRKWLAVGFYWLMFKISMTQTTPENLVPVLSIHAGLITALIITYTVGNNADLKTKLKGMDKTNEPLKEESTDGQA